jgi:hypothetical protein
LSFNTEIQRHREGTDQHGRTKDLKMAENNLGNKPFKAPTKAVDQKIEVETESQCRSGRIGIPEAVP